MKKYFIFAAAALVAMCACTKNDLDSSAIADQEIAFQVANYVGQTKALGTGEVSYYAAGHFGTYAWQVAEGKTWDNATEDQKSVFMNNVDIYKQSNIWKAEKSYYWPKTGTITFASYSPLASMAAQDTKPTVACGKDGIIKITDWTVNTDESAQAKNWTDDLMWATIASDKSANATTYESTGVPTLFHHALAKINLKIKQAATPTNSAYDFAVIIDAVKINGIKYEGDYTVGTGWTVDDNKTGGDAEIYKTGTYTAPSVGSNYSLPSGATALGSEASPYFSNYIVLPQELADDSTIEVKYTVITYDKNTAKTVVLVESTTTGAIKFNTMKLNSSTALNKWEENKNIIYTMTIAPVKLGPGPDPQFNEIYFDPAVVDWVDVNPVDQKL